jgi:hypothetical protein
MWSMIYCYLKVCQHIKVCDEIDFDNILFDLALCGRLLKIKDFLKCHKKVLHSWQWEKLYVESEYSETVQNLLISAMTSS